MTALPCIGYGTTAGGKCPNNPGGGRVMCGGCESAHARGQRIREAIETLEELAWTRNPLWAKTAEMLRLEVWRLEQGQ
jgi:hypothetical protein